MWNSTSLIVTPPAFVSEEDLLERRETPVAHVERWMGIAIGASPQPGEAPVESGGHGRTPSAGHYAYSRIGRTPPQSQRRSLHEPHVQSHDLQH
jgi:hypothetical protein